MKLSILPIWVSIIGIYPHVVKAQVREWKEADSDRKILGEMTDKTHDGNNIQIQIRDGKRIWIPLTKISNEDQEFAKKWARAMLDNDLISVSIKKIVTGMSDNQTKQRIILVKFQAGNEAMIVQYPHAKYYWPNTAGYQKVLKRNVAAGEIGEFEFTIYGDKYWTSAVIAGVERDMENNTRKTGISR